MTTYTGKFKHGMKIGSETHMDFELREMTTEDLLEAELEVGSDKPLNFSAALAARQLVRVGTFEGPFISEMVRKLEPKDFHTLRDGLNKVAALGEGLSPSSKTA